MRKLLAIAAVAGAVSAPIAAQAQTEITTGVVRGGSVIVEDDDDIDGIAVDQRPAFREYVVRERRPSYRYSDDLRVGVILPESGVTYYEMPAEYRAPGYRYTYVNERAVIVDPRTRRVIDIID